MLFGAGPSGAGASGGAWGSRSLEVQARVFPALEQFGPEAWLSCAGVGLRYLDIPERPRNARFDCAWGKEGSTCTSAWGEAF